MKIKTDPTNYRNQPRRNWPGVVRNHITSHRGNGNRPLKTSISVKYFLDNKC